MAFDIERTEYFNFTVTNHAEDSYKLLSVFASVGISLLAFKAISVESGRIRFTLFPNDTFKMAAAAKKAGLEIDGPHSALIVEGDDESGALADIFDRLAQAEIDMHESSGIADIKGGFGVVFYLDEEDYEKAAAVLAA